jgi:hypothetical protein
MPSRFKTISIFCLTPVSSLALSLGAGIASAKPDETTAQPTSPSNPAIALSPVLPALDPVDLDPVERVAVTPVDASVSAFSLSLHPLDPQSSKTHPDLNFRSVPAFYQTEISALQSANGSQILGLASVPLIPVSSHQAVLQPVAAPANTPATVITLTAQRTAEPQPQNSRQTLPSVLPASNVSSPLVVQAETVPADDSATAEALGGPVTEPRLDFQGAYILQGDEDTVRGRLVGVYPLSPRFQVGAVIDATDDGDFNVLEGAGVDLTELYVAAAPFDNLPNLRFVVGQIDFTSYFDRNSFAKDRQTHFFNSVFQTNPALQATTLTSRPGALVNWTVTDFLEARAGVFSSEPDLGDFSLDSFAGELGLRVENFIVRGTYVTSRDGGTRTGFDEIFSIPRGDDRFGTLDGDREESYGINAEYFIPEINLGLFGRYGHYRNTDLDEGGDTYSFGLNLLDLFMEDDRLGLGYGRDLSNDDLRTGDVPDVVELFYDARVLPNLRIGVTLQQRDEFSETVAGFRIRTDFDLLSLFDD